VAHLAPFARHHHERLDGSGYPDQLMKHQLPLELRILQVVDVYSALTLERTYKQARPAHEALNILRSDSKAYDKSVVEKLMYLLGIFPEGCSVKLSNGVDGIITDVSQRIPQFPSLKSLKTGEVIKLPNDYSITIEKIIEFHSTTFKNKHEALVNRLIEGKRDQAIQLYKDYSDGLKIEETYTRILLPCYFRLVSIKQNHPIKQAGQILDQLFERQKLETPTIKLEREMLLIVPEEQKDSFPIRVLRQLLHLENIDTIVLKYARIIKGWHIFYKYGVRAACLIIREHESEYHFIKDNRHIHVSTFHWNTFLTFLKQLTYIKAKRLNIYQQMFKDKT